jgi:hypothetical protein
MSDATDALENDFMELFFKATTWANVAQNNGTSPVTDWSQSLHTSSPGDAGNQTTNEIGYTSYVRKTNVRTGSGWSVTGGVASPVANQDFAAGTGGSGTATHMGLGRDSTSTGRLFMYGAISPNIVCGSGITPRLTTSTTYTLA